MTPDLYTEKNWLLKLTNKKKLVEFLTSHYPGFTKTILKYEDISLIVDNDIYEEKITKSVQMIKPVGRAVGYVLTYHNDGGTSLYQIYKKENLLKISDALVDEKDDKGLCGAIEKHHGWTMREGKNIESIIKQINT